VPLAVSTTGGNRHDVTQLIPLIDAIGPVAGKRGRPRQRPDALYGDRGYDYDKHRRLLRKRGVRPKIARRGVEHGSGLGKVRWVIERTFAWLHSFRRLRTRYERSGFLHNAFLLLGAATICQRLMP
jgi:transposase